MFEPKLRADFSGSFRCWDHVLCIASCLAFYSAFCFGVLGEKVVSPAMGGLWEEVILQLPKLAAAVDPMVKADQEPESLAGTGPAAQPALVALAQSASYAATEGVLGSKLDPAILSRVDALVRKITDLVIEVRRDIHANPELANREVRTSRVVAEHLRRFGIAEIQTGVAHHGVVALIRGRKPGPVIALRADMDALPIVEETGLPFASKNPGVMHACGHDAHTAMLLGAAAVFAELRDELPGTVKLIFQPAEEGVPPGEEGGARLMIAQGVLENPRPQAIFAQHVHLELPTGQIGYRAGGLMAAVDRFQLTVIGKQSHAAMPWAGFDPIVASAHIIAAMQTIVSRRIDTRKPVVVSFGKIRAGEAWNIIPEKVELEGTIRTHDPHVRELARTELQRIAEQVAAGLGTTAQLSLYDYGPVVWNDPRLLARVMPALQLAVGADNVVEVEPVMGGEDFAHYAQEVPGLYIFLGARNESIGAIHPVHTPKMIIDEAVLPIGVRTMCLVALQFMASHSTGSP